jgi:hypothetical protein
MRYGKVTICARSGKVPLGNWESLGGCARAPQVNNSNNSNNSKQ